MAETAPAEPAAPAPDAPPTNTEEYERIAAYPYPLHALSKRFAPHIVGLERAKRALVLSMASADDSATSRGRIHVLLHGPPSTAKTSLLYALAREAETDVFSQRISSGGLTLDFRTGKVGVFGALHDTEFQVVCLDELDKVPPEVADLLLSAMENGQITYAGGGQSGTIPAHLKVAAAANDASSLSQELLNRFDYRIFVPLPRRAEAGRIVDAMARGFMRPPGAGTEAGFVRGYLRWVHDIRPAFDDRERALAAHVFRVLVGTEPGEEVSLRPYQAVLRSAFAVARIERGDVTAERVMAAVELLYPERDFSDRFGALRGLLRFLRKSGRRAPRHWKPGA